MRGRHAARRRSVFTSRIRKWGTQNTVRSTTTTEERQRDRFPSDFLRRRKGSFHVSSLETQAAGRSFTILEKPVRREKGRQDEMTMSQFVSHKYVWLLIKAYYGYLLLEDRSNIFEYSLGPVSKFKGSFLQHEPVRVPSFFLSRSTRHFIGFNRRRRLSAQENAGSSPSLSPSALAPPS